MLNSSSHQWLQIANLVIGWFCLAVSIGLALVVTRPAGRDLPSHRRLMLVGLAGMPIAVSSRFIPLSIFNEMTGEGHLGIWFMGGIFLISVALLLLSLTGALRASRSGEPSASPRL